MATRIAIESGLHYHDDPADTQILTIKYLLNEGEVTGLMDQILSTCIAARTTHVPESPYGQIVHELHTSHQTIFLDPDASPDTHSMIVFRSPVPGEDTKHGYFIALATQQHISFND
jgi:hypothetical protein